MPVCQTLGSKLDWSLNDEMSCVLQLPPKQLNSLRRGDWEAAGIPETTKDRLEGLLLGVMMMTGLLHHNLNMITMLLSSFLIIAIVMLLY